MSSSCRRRLWKICQFTLISLFFLQVSETVTYVLHNKEKNTLISVSDIRNISLFCSPSRFPKSGLTVGDFPPLYDIVIVEENPGNSLWGFSSQWQVLSLGKISCEFETNEKTFAKFPVRDKYDMVLILLCPIPKLAKKVIQRKTYIHLRYADEEHIYVSPFLRACHATQAEYAVAGNQLPKRKIGACLLLQDKNHLIDEWIAYHRLLGVERVYIYFNEFNESSLVQFKKYFEEDFVVPIMWPFVSPNKLPYSRMQYVQINDCLWRFRYLHDWLLFSDVDEYIQPLPGLDGNSLKEFLESLESRADIGGVCAHNVFFGLDSKLSYEPSLLVTEQAMCRQERISKDRPKTIARPQNVYYMWNHKPSIGEKCLDADPYQELRLVHYKGVDSKPPKWYPPLTIFDNSMKNIVPLIKEQLRKQPRVYQSEFKMTQ